MSREFGSHSLHNMRYQPFVKLQEKNMSTDSVDFEYTVERDVAAVKHMDAFRNVQYRVDEHFADFCYGADWAQEYYLKELNEANKLIKSMKKILGITSF